MREDLQRESVPLRIQLTAEYAGNYIGLCMTKALPDYEEKVLLNHLNKNREKLVLKRDENYSQQFSQFQPIIEVNPL